MRLGLPEILLIALVVVLFVNPRQLPGLFRRAGRLYQQIKAMRESFVRGMNEIDREVSGEASWAASSGASSEPAARGGGSADGRTETARMALRTQTESLPFERRVMKALPASSPTTIHVCTSTGMGDRVVFQGIIRHSILTAGPQGRVVAAVYESGQKYFVRHYKPAPHEIWTMQRPVSPLETERQIATAVMETGSSLFPDAASFTLYDYGGTARPSVSGCAVVAAEMYSYYAATVAVEGIYPRFPVTKEAVANARTSLGRLGEPPGRPFVALHCRNRAGAPEKNPCRDDMISLARELRRRSAALVLVPEAEAADRELEALCDYTCPLDPSLQEPAALLKLCHVFIGGDSGPAHLAAAVGTPVVSLRPPKIPWLNGPFCEEGRLTSVQGTLVEHDGHIALSFDVDAALAGTLAFLNAVKTTEGRDRPRDPAEGKVLS